MPLSPAPLPVLPRLLLVPRNPEIRPVRDISVGSVSIFLDASEAEILAGIAARGAFWSEWGVAVLDAS